MSTLDTERICQIFKSMDLSKSKLNAASSVVPKDYMFISFINGELISLPAEQNPTHLSFWKESNIAWSKLSDCQRIIQMDRMAEIIEKEKLNLCKLEGFNEHPLLLKRFLNEIIPALASYIRYYASCAYTKCDYVPKGKIIVDVRAAAFPLLEAIFCLAPALSRGDTVTILCSKFYELTQFLSLTYLAKTFTQNGLPAGTINTLVTLNETTPLYSELIEHQAIISLPFQSAKNAGVDNSIKFGKSSFNMHGKSYMLVLRHCDHEAAAQACVNEAIRSTRMTCWPLTEVLVEEYIYSDFVNALKLKVNSINVEDIPNIFQGDEVPLKVEDFAKISNLELVRKAGLLILLGGRIPETLNSWEMDTDCQVLGVLPVRSHTEALNIVNSRPRFLSASVWTEESSLAMQVASALKMGLVWINNHGTIPAPAAGYGNWSFGGDVHFGGKAELTTLLKADKQTTPNNEGKRYLIVKESDKEKVKLQTMHHFHMFWGGEPHRTSQTYFILDSNKKHLGTSSFATSKEVGAAVGAAFKAWPNWMGQGPEFRAAALKTLVSSMLQGQETFLALLKAAYGLDDSQATYKLQAAMDVIYKWASQAHKIHGDMIGNGKVGTFLTSRQSLGVVSLCGYTASLESLLNLVTAALVFGNTVVVCASPDDCLPSLLLAETLFLKTGLPPGVLNVLSWGVEATLAAHPDVACIWTTKPNASKLSSPSFKRVWHVTENCSDDYILYQATKLKTIAL